MERGRGGKPLGEATGGGSGAIGWESVEDCEGSGIFPYLQANKLACHGFRDAGRIHETSESETNVITAMAVAGVLAFAQFPDPQFVQGDWKRAG